MPTVAGPAAHRGNCRKQGARFQRCSGCRVPECCSRECQKVDWKQHQPFCQDRKSALQGVADPDVSTGALLLSRWFDHWHRALFCWAAFLADLANQPTGFLESHCFLLCVRRRSEVVQACMVSDDHIANLARKVGGTDDDTADLLARHPTCNVLRAIVVHGEALMSSKLSLMDLFPYKYHMLLTDTSSPRARLTSSAFHSPFLTEFGPAVRNGDVVSCFQVVAQIVQEIEDAWIFGSISL
ncbi:hypothetical protein B0H10DRAFT_1940744 [Mycena sp. CBHHK59/15]|nr:hypothetical protein B0H10DRAFT_1940744 [Mycena sp. CBHHK59/15]